VLEALLSQKISTLHFKRFYETGLKVRFANVLWAVYKSYAEFP